MKILFLHTHLHPEVTAAVERHAPGADWRWVGADDRAPWREVRQHWGAGDDLVFIEQHAVIHAGIIPGFRDCPAPWCTQLSEVVLPGNWTYEAFSAVRFRQEMMAQVPVTEIEAGWGSCGVCGPDGQSGTMPSPSGPGCWRHMDGAVITPLREHGFAPCVHEPPVFHWKVHRNGGVPCAEREGQVAA